MIRIISEPEFNERINEILVDVKNIGSVTGPGRSGSIAAVYASHILGVPYIPFNSNAPNELGRLLIIDTARESGATLRKAVNRYLRQIGLEVVSLVCYEEPPRVAFWYEAAKPQRYRHERENHL